MASNVSFPIRTASIPCLALLICLASAPAAQDAIGAGGAAPESSSMIERIRTERVVLPVLFRADEKAPGACTGLGAADLRVFEDGQPVLSVESVDRQRRPAMHAIVMDVSASMSGRLPDCRQAAKSYIDQLRPGEEAMVLSFDDRLILRAPPTTDRERLRSAIDQLEAGSSTLMWDALYQVIGQLAARPERKVIVLLTDGADTLSLTPFQDLLGLASSTPDLSIFAIGLDLPERGGSRAVLRDLTRATDGAFFDLRDLTRLPELLQGIRDLLDSEAYVVYEPVPFGRNRRDPDPRKISHAFRKVSVDLARNGTSCRIKTLRRQRFAGEKPGAGAGAGACASDEIRADPAGRVPAGLRPPPATCPFPLPARWRGLRVEWKDPSCASGSFLRAESGGITGCALDILREWGPRFFGRIGPVGPAPLFGLRRFFVALGPLATLPRTPAQIFMRWMIEGVHPTAAVNERPYETSPFLLNGQTFLEMRGQLARVLFDHYPEYRLLLQDNLRRRAREEQEAWELEVRRGVPELPDADLARLRSLRQEELFGRLSVPTETDLQENLGEWLGDIEARTLALQIEKEAANLFLTAPPGEGSSALENIDRIEASWGDLAFWFATSERARIVTPLVPVFDGSRDRVGFWRVVIPRPAPIATGLAVPALPPREILPEDRLPARPAGLRLIRRLLESDDVRLRLSDRFRVASLCEEPLSGAELRNMLGKGRLKEVGRRGFTLSIQLESREKKGTAGNRPLIEIEAFLTAAPDGEPVILAAKASGVGGAEAETLARDIERALMGEDGQVK
ncbi:MAG: hypothetical protein DMF49_05755 [Acidobacteria bacterium]|nr:MAG: hypothetical protein DMF49_05755 [Acidobacteriota bacterium]